MRKLMFLSICAALMAGFVADAAWAVKWFSRGHGRAPEANRVFVCHAYSCRMVTPVSLSDADIRKIAGDLRRGMPDAEAEIKAISGAVQRFERMVGARIGTGNDLPGMQFGQAKPDQMDCIDEATNTTSLLVLLSAHGYLKHHDVREPSSRGFFLDGRYPHATAVVAVRGSKEKWAIDSWPNANGEPPVIQPLSVWKRSRNRGGS